MSPGVRVTTAGVAGLVDTLLMWTHDNGVAAGVVLSEPAPGPLELTTGELTADTSMSRVLVFPVVKETPPSTVMFVAPAVTGLTKKALLLPRVPRWRLLSVLPA